MARILTLKLTLTLSHTHTFTHTQYTNSLIPAKYAAVNTSSGCGIVSCKDVCGADYQFSDGCGPTYEERAYVHHAEHGTWLLDSANTHFNFSSFDIDVNEWTLQTTGVCTLCKFCGTRVMTNIIHIVTTIKETPFAKTSTGTFQEET